MNGEQHDVFIWRFGELGYSHDNFHATPQERVVGLDLVSVRYMEYYCI
jgi:hypothetical protein